MSKCSKVKNPCKICLGPVTQKNGLQCHGICESWVHYTCLNYTPGRISDIKKGIINVTCPCPDCKTQLPKEYRPDDKSFSCTNQNCPVNQPPRCDNKMCPINLQYPSIPELEPNLEPNLKANNFTQCGTDCSKFSKTQLPPGKVTQGTQGPPCPPTAPDPTNVCRLPPLPQNGGQAYGSLYKNANSSTTSPVPTPPAQDSPHRSHDMSNTSLGALEQMCNTVGQLAHQINDLMYAMKEAVNQTGLQGCRPSNKKTCNQKGPKAKCPKPCHCPGNPGKRK